MTARIPLSAMPEIAALPALLTADEVALLFRSNRKAIYTRVKRGNVPGVIYDGRRLLFVRDEVVRYLEEHRAPPLEEAP